MGYRAESLLCQKFPNKDPAQRKIKGCPRPVLGRRLGGKGSHDETFSKVKLESVTPDPKIVSLLLLGSRLRDYSLPELKAMPPEITCISGEML